MIWRRLARSGTTLTAAVALLSACSMDPEYQKPEMPGPDRFRGAQTEPVAQLPDPSTRWWTEFGSTELNQWVDRAIANNQDVKAAIQRVRQADLAAVAAGATKLPNLGLVGNRNYIAPEAGVGTIAQTEKRPKLYHFTQFGLRVSYEVDLWGKNASLAEAALARAEASEFDRQVVVLSLVSDVVSNYLQALQNRQTIDLVKSNIENLRNTLSVVNARAAIQEATVIEVAQQEAALAQAESLLPIYQNSYEQTLNRLAVLLGEAPAALPPIAGPAVTEIAVPTVQTVLPSTLLLRRPDVRKAEANLRAANANIGLARAKLLPSFSLTGDGGLGSRFLQSLLSPNGIYYDLIASFAQVIFDGGRADAEVAYNQSQFEELAAIYRQSMLSALREVEDFLASTAYLADQEKAENRRAVAARQAYEASRRAFAAGRLEYQTVLETERAHYVAEFTVLETRLARLKGAISLFKALGGDLTTPPE